MFWPGPGELIYAHLVSTSQLLLVALAYFKPLVVTGCTSLDAHAGGKLDSSILRIVPTRQFLRGRNASQISWNEG